MPEHLKALIIILALASGLFAIARIPVCAVAMSADNFARRRNLWFSITLVAFLSHNFWVFIVVSAVLLLVAMPKEPNKLAAYYFVLFAMSPLSDQISGFGIINQFFTIDYIRLLSLGILSPAFISLSGRQSNEKFGRSLTDKFVIGYLALQLILILKASSVTNTMRVGIFYGFIDVFLPYYVASRSIKDLAGFREVVMAFVVAAMVLALVGVYEFSRHWLLYKSLEDVYGYKLLAQNFMTRGDSVRAMGSAGGAIPLGYIMAVATGLYLFLRSSVPSLKLWLFGLLMLLIGLYAPVSRGPWIGFATMLLVYTLSGPAPGREILRFVLIGAVAVPAMLISPMGDDIIDRLPFVGRAEMETVTYRQRLLEISIAVVMQNPFFGAFDYFYSSAMQELKQGQGIIDMVNTHLGVALGSGLVGLTRFIGVFIAAADGVFRAMRKLPDRTSELYLLGRTLFAVMIGIQVIIFTVSSISFIAVIYWSIAGLGVAYARMLNSERAMMTGAHLDKSGRTASAVALAHS